MKIQNIFYTIGVVFIICAVVYFVFQFIKDLPDMLRLFILIVSVIVSFILAEMLRSKDW
jgi:ABC-type multidrug transport system permease subunit